MYRRYCDTENSNSSVVIMRIKRARELCETLREKTPENRVVSNELHIRTEVDALMSLHFCRKIIILWYLKSY